MSKSARRKAQRQQAELRQHEAFLERENNRSIFGPLQARNASQKSAIGLLHEKRIVFLTGPAGTGKTFCATSYAAEQLANGTIKHIVFTRPMVGCDEDIGFLPGTEEEKFEGWVAPFIEILEGKLGRAKVKSLLGARKIQANPLMRMRGATFRDSIVILDEAQNTTPGQMKMFLTRLGEGSKVFILGDEEQSDLPAHKDNGLTEALSILKDSVNIGRHSFTEQDITRDALVREIVFAYRRKDRTLKSVA